MCKLPVFAFTLVLSLPLFAQLQNGKNTPAWGKIEKAELESRDCEFDKNAEAVVLFDVGELVSNDLQSLEFRRYVRIKILNDKGLNLANIKIPFYKYRMEESIKDLEAQTINLDAAGKIATSEVEPDLFYENKLNKRFSEKVFTFPEVKVGSVIEYRYTLVGLGLRNWYFQKSIPVKHSSYKVDVPIEYEVILKPTTSLPFESKKDSIAKRVIQTFNMQNIPALRDEPFITCEDDYLQRIETRLVALNFPRGRVSYRQTWSRIITQLMEDEDFGLQLKKEIHRTSDLDAALKTLQTEYEKMLAIHKYVRNNMAWNGYDNIWALDGVKAAWKEKKGTSGEINLVLVNLLKDAGLDANPVLVSTREHGIVDRLEPSIHQFDKVMAYVRMNVKNKNEIYVLDATDKYTPSHLVPQDVMYSNGLLIEKLGYSRYQGEWKTLWNEAQGFKNIVILNAEIDQQGQMKGRAAVNSFDYTRVNRLTELKKGTDKFIEKYYTNENPNVKIDSFSISNAENDSLPLEQDFQFSETIAASGDYRYFSINKFSGLEKNPFVADTRFSDVFFGAFRNYFIIGNFTIPDGYSFDELPKNIRMILPDTSISFSRSSAVSENQLSVRINLEFKKPFYRVDEYPGFKEFYKKLFDLLNEQFVFRKNAKL